MFRFPPASMNIFQTRQGTPVISSMTFNRLLWLENSKNFWASHSFSICKSLLNLLLYPTFPIIGLQFLEACVQSIPLLIGHSHLELKHMKIIIELCQIWGVLVFPRGKDLFQNQSIFALLDVSVLISNVLPHTNQFPRLLTEVQLTLLSFATRELLGHVLLQMVTHQIPVLSGVNVPTDLRQFSKNSSNVLWVPFGFLSVIPWFPFEKGCLTCLPLHLQFHCDNMVIKVPIENINLLIHKRSLDPRNKVKTDCNEINSAFMTRGVHISGCPTLVQACKGWRHTKFKSVAKVSETGTTGIFQIWHQISNVVGANWTNLTIEVSKQPNRRLPRPVCNDLSKVLPPVQNLLRCSAALGGIAAEDINACPVRIKVHSKQSTVIVPYCEILFRDLEAKFGWQHVFMEPKFNSCMALMTCWNETYVRSLFPSLVIPGSRFLNRYHIILRFMQLLDDFFCPQAGGHAAFLLSIFKGTHIDCCDLDPRGLGSWSRSSVLLEEGNICLRVDFLHFDLRKDWRDVRHFHWRSHLHPRPWFVFVRQ